MLSDKMLVTSYAISNTRTGFIIGLLRPNKDGWTLYNTNGQPVQDLSNDQVNFLRLVDNITLDEPLEWDESDLATRGSKLGIPTV